MVLACIVRWPRPVPPSYCQRPAGAAARGPAVRLPMSLVAV